MYVYPYTYVYIYVYIYTLPHTHKYANVYIYIYVYVHGKVRTCICILSCIHIFLFMVLYNLIYTYIHYLPPAICQPIVTDSPVTLSVVIWVTREPPVELSGLFRKRNDAIAPRAAL